MSQEQQPIRFAYWVPNVSGGLVVSKIEQRTSWDIDYNRKLAQLAERNGFDYALSQIRFTAGYGAEYQHESVAISHALLAATEKLKVIAAILPGPWHPAVVAKQLAMAPRSVSTSKCWTAPSTAANGCCIPAAAICTRAR